MRSKSKTRPESVRDISIVIPVYDEGANIHPLATEIRGALAERVHYELIYVDDGSNDDTADEVERLTKQDLAVSLCRHGTNRGQSAAVRTGVKAAKSEIVAVLDGDGQNDPADIPALLDALRSDSAVRLVIGERQKRRDKWLRRVSSRIANRVRSWALKDGISDTGCGIKVFYRRDFLELPAFDHMHRFLPALFQRNGGKVLAVPVNHRARLTGYSKYGVNNRLWVGIADLIGVIWLQNRRI